MKEATLGCERVDGFQVTGGDPAGQLTPAGEHEIRERRECSGRRLLLSHIVPNSLPPLIVQTTLSVAFAILEAAALGFLGLGAQPPTPEWGAMLADSYKYFTSGAWWVFCFPGAAIMLSVLGFNLLGDGLRDALDPRLGRR